MPQKSGESSQCSGKKRYQSYYAAERGSRGLNNHYQNTRGNPYHCEYCHSYHVGNSSVRTKKKLNRHARRER